MQIVQIGVGGVGRTLLEQVLRQRDALAARYGFRLEYAVLADSSGVVAGEPIIAGDTLRAALDAKAAGTPLAALSQAHSERQWAERLPQAPCIVVDVSAADGQAPALIAAVQAGHRVVLANKRPLSGSLADFQALTAGGATRYEATVGAGLPVIGSMQALLDSGDTIRSIEACLSGTLGFIASELDAGRQLSAAVQRAYDLGYTEPDPRDDLSGADVARKALILARTCGLPWEFEQLAPEPLFSRELATITRDAFLERLGELDAPLADRVAAARAQNHALRYVAQVTPAGPQIALRGLPQDHPLSALRGPDNMFTISTDRYVEYPLIIRGPGAGQAVTAAGVLGDIVATARELAS